MRLCKEGLINSGPGKINAQPRYLGFLILSYTAVILLANWFDVRLVKLLSITTDAGTLIFPLTFLISDMMTEVYGYQQARRAIWAGFLFNGLFILYSLLVSHMPSPDFANHNAEFDQILRFNIRIILASILSYFIAEPLNAYLMAKLKIKTKGRYMGLRFLGSTLIAAFFDSSIFSFAAFFGLMPTQDLLFFILDMWLVKVFIELIGLPISIYLVRKLKKIEGLNIYDRKTKFNLFSLKVTYTPEDNP